MRITRREFLRMAAYAAAAAGVSQFDILRLQKAMAATGDKPAVIWFEGLGDSGCVVSLANYFDGTSGIDSVLLNSIELKFNSVLMGASGQLAIDEAEKVYQATPPYDTQPYVLVVTGGIANLDGYCIVLEDYNSGNAVPDGKMQMVDALSRWQTNAAYVLYVGACACYGGVNTIRGNYKATWNPLGQNPGLTSPPTHDKALPYGSLVQIEHYNYGKSVFIPGCPAHPDWIVLTIVHLLTYGMPTRDNFGRPLTLMGQNIFNETVHQNCPRKIQHDLGNFAEWVGDTDKCMRMVGCRGKETHGPCPVMGWNKTDLYNSGKLAYCTALGINHICVGCTEVFFPDVPLNREINNIDTTP